MIAVIQITDVIRATPNKPYLVLTAGAPSALCMCIRQNKKETEEYECETKQGFKNGKSQTILPIVIRGQM